jgi:RNA polymerase sigma-70 factor (ECF subfamily)
MATAMALSPLAVEGGSRRGRDLSPEQPEPRDGLDRADERETVLRARAGDPAARETLALAHRQAAFLLALQLMGNREDALDAAQDSMLRFFTTLDRFHHDQPIRPWLFSIVRNRCRDLMRRGRVRRSEPIDSEPDRWRPELVDGHADPHRDAEQSELRGRVFAALGALNREQREILVLRDYQDLSYEEIANVLRVPKGTVMSRLHRARKALAASLGMPAGAKPAAVKPAKEEP